MTAQRASAPARLDDVDLIAGARERRSAHAQRRELWTESAVAAAFLATCFALTARWPAAGDVAVAAWLALLCALLVRVEFEVGEGCTRPVQLVLAPMLVLLPSPWVPLVVACGHVAAQLPEVALGRAPLRRIPMALADCWFCIAPTLVLLVAGPPGEVGRTALLVGLAVISQIGVDFLVSALRLCIGLGSDLRSSIRPFAWVYLVDLMLIPIGLLAAAGGSLHPLAVGGVVPLAALLAIFARERSGRIENAVALQQMAQEAEERLQSIVQNASDLIAIVAPDGTISKLTGSVATVFGEDWQAAQGTALADHVHPEDAPTVRAFLAMVAGRAGGDSQEAEWRMRYPDGGWRHVSALATNLIHDPRVAGLVVTARDVDERKAFEEQLRHRAFHDPLTSLANRALFYDRVEHALSRERGDGHVAVLYVDLDDFKSVNDRYGHATGDTLLVEVARRLHGCLRSEDTVARLGGDEFGVLFEAVAGPNEPIQAAERILSALREPMPSDAGAQCLSGSAGVALAGLGDRGVDELLRRADLAMYAAKRNGKRRIELYTPALAAPEGTSSPTRAAWLHSTDEQREQVLSVLHGDDALTIALQPILDLRTGRVAGFEALSRFTDALQRPPNAWFAQAHRCGLGPELEAKALAAALALPGRPAGTYLTLNASPSALLSEPVARVLPDRLDDLVVEITENEVVSEDPQLQAALADLRRRGARVAVDDTGSGYAGLTHVMRIAPDIIKLDRTLVTGVHADSVKAALIESFVHYARRIDASVCAEGIEDVADLRRLADLDVAYGQGYAIGRPGPPWPAAASEASDACNSSFIATLVQPTAAGNGLADDLPLEILSDGLASADCATDLAPLLDDIARELHADAVRVVVHDGLELAHQDLLGALPAPVIDTTDHLLISDPTAALTEVAALSERGFQSRLRLPIRTGGVVVGTLEAYARGERPWSRFEIRRGRIISHSVAAVIARDRAGVV